jgi:hypothetical protein
MNEGIAFSAPTGRVAVSRPVSKVTKHTGVFWVSWNGLLVTAVQLEPCALGQVTHSGT